MLIPYSIAHLIFNIVQFSVLQVLRFWLVYHQVHLVFFFSINSNLVLSSSNRYFHVTYCSFISRICIWPYENLFLIFNTFLMYLIIMAIFPLKSLNIFMIENHMGYLKVAFYWLFFFWTMVIYLIYLHVLQFFSFRASSLNDKF